MKTKPRLTVLALTLSIPAFFAGGYFPADQKSATTEPVRQVIEAIDSAPLFVNSSAESELQTAAIFDSLHQRTVASFVATFNSFGITRIARVEDMRHSDLWTLHPGRTDGFEVSLIGLDREEPARFERVPPGPNPPLQQVLAKATKPHSSETEAELVPLDSLDQDALARFESAEAARRAIFSGHDKVTAFGPIRSTESCLKCHDGDAGDLLGVFRYTFPVPGRSLNLRLAGTP